MKYYIIILVAAIAILTVSSCHTGSGTTPPPVTPTTPVSTFNITYNGKTYNLTSGGGTVINATCMAPIAGTPIPEDGLTLLASNTHIQGHFFGIKRTDLSNYIGVYHPGFDYTKEVMELDITDYDDGAKKYTSDFTGKDSTSIMTVTTNTTTECKGTFSVILSYMGNYYPATGDFDYKH